MFTKKPTDENSVSLDEAIDQLLREMYWLDCASDEYAKMADQLTKLYSLKETDSKKRVSPDTLAVIIGNLVGIVMIVGHERVHVITSKALNFVPKPR